MLSVVRQLWLVPFVLRQHRGDRSAHMRVLGDRRRHDPVDRLRQHREGLLARSVLGVEVLGHLSGGEEGQRHKRGVQLLGHLVWQVLPEFLEPLVPTQEAAGLLGNRRVVLEVGEHVVTQRAVRGEQRWRVEHRRVDRVVQRHDLADDLLRLVTAGIVDLLVAEDDRQPLGRRDHFGGADDGEEKALQLVIAKRARRSGRMVQERLEGAGVGRGRHQLRGYR